MTFGEIYSRVAFMVWGNSTVPTGTVGILTGDEGLIAQTHKDIMREYNYWFMHTTVAFDTVADQASYALPSDYKELIDAQFKANGQEFFIDPMSHMAMKVAQQEFWTTFNGSAEYPTHYEISDTSIVLYPKPNAARECHICYWKFLTGPTTSFVDGTSSESNDLTSAAGDAIAYFAASRILEMLDEFQKSVIYFQRGQAIIDRLRQEDKRRRSKFEDLDYRSF